MKWDFDSKDKGCARVFYYNGDINELVSTTPPKDLNKDYILPEIKVIFNSKYNVPLYGDFDNLDDNKFWDSATETLENSKYLNYDHSIKLLGYPDIIQNDMLLECELVTNGIYCGDSSGYESPERKELERNKNQWKLLYQLDTVTKDDYELMFGDCGRIYFYIKKHDLKNKNFDNIWLILQCC